MGNLDTENKRRSVTGILNLYTIPPVPDGTIAALDRMQATLLYSGITPQSTVPVTETKFKLYDLVTWIIAPFRKQRLKPAFARSMSNTMSRANRRFNIVRPRSTVRITRIPRRSTRRYTIKHYTYLFEENKKKKRKKNG
jgi:hypothetical protein